MTEKIKNLLEVFLKNLPSIVFILIPLFFIPNSIDPFSTNKFYLINVIATISVLAWALKNILDNKISITVSTTTTSLFLLCLTHIISAYFISPTKVLSFTGITTLFASLFLIHLSYTSTKSDRNSLLSAKYSLLTSSVLVSLFTIFQYLDLTKYFFNNQLFANQYTNLTGSLISAIAFTVPILAGVIADTIKLNSNSHRAINLIIISILATATTINLIFLLPKDNNNINTLPLNTSWAIALDIFKYPATAMLGTGPETYLTSFTRLRPVYLNMNPKLWNTRFSESGSLFLTILTTSGLFGGFFLLLPYLKNLKSKFAKKSTSFYAFTSTGFLLAFIFTPVGITGIITATIILSILTQIEKDDNGKTKTIHLKLSSDDNQNTTFTKFLPFGVLIATITLLASYWNFGYRFYLASTKIYQANKQINDNLSESFNKQVEAQKLNPFDPTYSVILSRTYQQVALYYLNNQNPTEQDKRNSVDMMQRSIDAARTASSSDPFNVITWENLSSIYQSFIGAADGSVNLAISHLAQAISLDPTNPRLRLQLGILYYNLQDKEQATKLINQAAELKPNWSAPYQNLYRIYMEDKDYQRAKIYLEESLKHLDNNSDEAQKLQQELINLNKDISANK